MSLLLRPGFAYGFFYFAFFAFHAVNRSFFPLHCKEVLGLGSFQIALVTSAEDIANIIGPPLMLHLAHSWASAKQLVLYCSVAAFILLIPLLGLNWFIAVLLFWFLALLMSRAPIILVEAAAIRDAETKGLNYGRIRVAGSLGFIGFTFLVGFVYDLFGPVVIIPSAVVLSLLLIYATKRAQPLLRTDVPARVLKSHAKMLSLLRGPQSVVLRRFLAVVFLLWASHSVLYTYFSIHLKTLGWSGTMISAAWGMSVGAELFVFYYFDSLQKHFSLQGIFRFSLICASIRWFALGAAESTPLILLAQTLHSFSLIGFHVACMKMIFQVLPEDYRDRSLGLLTAAGVGFGVFFGRMLAGFGASMLPEGVGLNVLFYGAGALTVLGYLVSRTFDLEEAYPAEK